MAQEKIDTHNLTAKQQHTLDRAMSRKTSFVVSPWNQLRHRSQKQCQTGQSMTVDWHLVVVLNAIPLLEAYHGASIHPVKLSQGPIGWCDRFSNGDPKPEDQLSGSKAMRSSSLVESVLCSVSPNELTYRIPRAQSWYEVSSPLSNKRLLGLYADANF
jgi:hypothetical protein